jgi:hypothetical protein
MSDATIMRGLSKYIPRTSIKQICDDLLRVEDDHGLAGSIEVYDITW